MNNDRRSPRRAQWNAGRNNNHGEGEAGPSQGQGNRNAQDRYNNNGNEPKENINKGKRHENRRDIERPRRQFPIGYKKLEELLQLFDAQLILQLSAEGNGFLLLLQQPGIKEGLMCLILSAFAKASDCATDGNTQQLLIHFFTKILPSRQNESTFFAQELRIFVTFLPKRIEPNYREHERYIQSILDLLKFLRRLQLTMFKRSCDVINDIAPLITAQIDFINRKGQRLSDETIELLADINASIETGVPNQEENEKAEALFEPPEDYRTISIFPTSQDISFDHEPFIRKNITDGKYKGGVDHYLDVQFRLLREDFVRPLREGISEFLRLKNDKPNKLTKIKDVNIYFDVHLIKSAMKNGDLIYTVQFDIKKFKHVRWQASKRFLYGSLVCLTADDFQTFCFATVAGQRNPETLEKGQFQISFQFQDKVTDAITPMTTLTMVESQVYFEAYRHNLLVLQQLKPDTFPLKRYVIDVEKEVLPPPYLNQETIYDLSKTIPEFCATKEEEKMKKINDYELAEKVSRCGDVHILNDELWPDRKYFGLDEAQFAAYKAALTKQFVVIQGPPGTGKTFIGLKITKALLENSRAWQRSQSLNPRPILVVCYTNHALDQFLEGILSFCDNIVRIGGKSQSEVLQAYNLITLKTQLKHNRKIPDFIYKSRWESNAKLKDFQEKLGKLESRIEAASKEILGFQLVELIGQFSERQYSQLTNFGGSVPDVILQWLGYQVHTISNGNQHYFDYEEENEAMDVDNEADGEDDGDDAESIVDEEEVKEIENMRQFDEEPDEESDEEEEVGNESARNGGNRVVNYVPAELGDGFRMQRQDRKKMKQNLRKELRSKDAMTAEQAIMVTNIWTLNAKDRWRLYRFWLTLYTQAIESEIKDLRVQLTSEWKQFTALRNQEDIEVVKGKAVIAMTTTGAAKYHHIIAAIKPRIVIVEEAAEVLEAHIITSLSHETEHLILIGDHQQLKPNPAVYELARKFNLEVSLFERMLTNGLNCYQLKTQHRMRPCISELLVPHIYKELIDHPSVYEYENIKGISSNLFFVNHNQLETNVNDTKSRMNEHEAKFIVELCRYLVLQGYKTSQITILTMYSGQLFKVRTLIRGISFLKGVRATVVDNYQGEENDIILMTFVRSNIEGDIGFLKVSNRVNVSLSRARKGLYCIGNFDCLAEKSTLWQTIIKILQRNNSFGDSLPIYCQNHETKDLITTADDFKKAPEGGCLKQCGARLPCGHVCPSTCHIIDAGHEETVCHKLCEKPTCERDHRCKKKCHFEEACGPCERPVSKYRDECGHTVNVKCSESASSASCRAPCEKTRLCGHKCLLTCSADCDSAPCQTEVGAYGPCSHLVPVRCYQRLNEVHLLDSCRSPCGIELNCGHRCRGSCGQCKQGRLHSRCKERCTKILICGHKCKHTCGVACPPCKEKCTVECSHSKCNLLCGALCAPCSEKCTWGCEHARCTKLCHEFCNRKLCEQQPCKKLLKCGHECIGLCGELCPRACRICNKDEVEEVFFGSEDEENARFIQMVDCPHFIEVTGLIQWLEMDASQDSNSVQMKSCPKCKAVIRKTRSLNTYIQGALKDVEQIKAKTVGNNQENKEKQVALNAKIKSKLLNFGRLPSTSFHFRKVRTVYDKLCYETELVKRRRALPKTTLLRIENVLEILKKIADIFENTSFAKYSGTTNLNIDLERMMLAGSPAARSPQTLNIGLETIEKLENRTLQSLAFLYDFNNSPQHQHDITNEVLFLDMVARNLKKINQGAAIVNEKGKEAVRRAFLVALGIGRVTDKIKAEFKSHLDEASKHLTGLGISAQEKSVIIQAMGLSQGHWYKCPNGHVYCIADCGGATHESRCNECGARIGGGGHRLRSDNALATEMDGATRSAWPGGA